MSLMSSDEIYFLEVISAQIGSLSCKKNWNFTKKSSFDHSVVYIHTPCTEKWYGIQCKSNALSIVNVSICNITGSIPTEIKALHNLLQLNLSYNSMNGRNCLF
jgi:hypothetical protein